MKNKRILALLIAAIAIFGMSSVAFAKNMITVRSDKPTIPRSECDEAGTIAINADNDTTFREGDIIKYTLSNGVTLCKTIDFYVKLTDKDGNKAGVTEIGKDQTAPIQTTTGSQFDFFQISSLNGGPSNTIGEGLNGITEPAGPGNYIPTDGSWIVGDDARIYDMGFRVQGTKGDRTIYMTFGKRLLGYPSTDGALIRYAEDGEDTDGDGVKDAYYGAFTANPQLSGLQCQFNAADTDTVLIIKLFDGNDNQRYFFETVRGKLLNQYIDSIEGESVGEGDNTLCIDTSLYTPDYVYAVPTSEPVSVDFQLAFFGDYIVAQIVSAVTYEIGYACKDVTCPEVSLQTTTDQFGNTLAGVKTFDIGNYYASCLSSANPADDRWRSSGDICYASVSGLEGSYYGNGLRFYKQGSGFATNDQYRITLQLMVGTNMSANHAYWASSAPEAYITTPGVTDGCLCTSDPMKNTYGFSWHYETDGVVTDKTKIVGTSDVLVDPKFIEWGYGAFVIDLPAVVLGASATAGSQVTVKATFEKLPCGTVAQEEICLANLVTACATTGSVTIDGIAFIGDKSLASVLHGYLARLPLSSTAACHAQGSSLTFPYVPALDDAMFFTGIVLNNIGSANADLTITIYDKDGGSSSYATSLEGGKQMITTLDALKAELEPGTTPLDTTKSGYVKVVATASAD